jgi:hypothetical protein
MRPRPGTAAVALLLAAVAACTPAPPAGLDGDLTDDWPAPPAPTSFRPVAGECHEALAETAPMAGHRPVDCGELHVAETFHVGDAPAAPVPPGGGSAAMHAAYADCAERAEGFLGGPWRGARIVVRVVWPSRAGWSGGARWYRCDAAQADLDGGGDAARTGSLAGALRDGDSPLLLRCFDPQVRDTTVRTMAPVSCTKRHAAEFAGLWTAPDVPYAEQARDRTRSAAGCRSVIARYTGVPDDDDVQYRTGWISFNPTRIEWQQGERRVRCFLWSSDGALTRSLAGAGPGALPVR